MLQIYRRHTPACPKKYTERSQTKCTCVIRVEGMLRSNWIRRSTKTRSWSAAEEMVQAAEKSGVWDQVEQVAPEAKAEPANTPIRKAVDMYLIDLEKESGQNVIERSMMKYRTTIQRLEKFAIQSGLVEIGQIDDLVLIAFKDTWETGALTTVHYINRLVTFGNFCVARHWWTENHARKIKRPRNFKRIERIPFDEKGQPSEMDRILEAAGKVELGQSEFSNFELVTFIMVMRHLGMAISDATLLCDDEVLGDTVRYYRKKMIRNNNRILVEIYIPPFLQERLAKLKRERGLVGPGKKYYFCHGSADIVIATQTTRHLLEKVFKKAGLHGESHQFRHTFAHYWLFIQKTDLETVARWMGHQNSAVTRKYYSHWITDRVDAATQMQRDHWALQAHVSG